MFTAAATFCTTFKSNTLGTIKLAFNCSSATHEAIASCVAEEQLNANFIVPSVFDLNVVQKVAAAVKKSS